jgi:flagellar biosynthesis/type III secretory pathway chaperone
MSVQAVVEAMDRMTEIHGVLLELAEQKKHAIVRNDIDLLNQITHQENKLIKQIEELDRQRTEAIGQALIQRGYRPNPRITVSDLIRLIYKAEDKQALMRSRDELLAAIDKLRAAHSLNQQLIRQSLAFIEYSLDLLIGPPEDEAVYQNPAQHARNVKRIGVFDTKA